LKPERPGLLKKDQEIERWGSPCENRDVGASYGGLPWPSGDHATGEVQLTTFNGKIVYRRNGNSSNQGVQQ